MEVSDATRILFISGQIPVTADGSVPESFEEQARLAWANVIAQMRAAGMTLDNLVKVTIFLSDRKYIADYRKRPQRSAAGPADRPDHHHHRHFRREMAARNRGDRRRLSVNSSLNSIFTITDATP